MNQWESLHGVFLKWIVYGLLKTCKLVEKMM